MSYCELCGCQITGEVIPVVVESVVMNVCRPCSKHGKPYVSKKKDKMINDVFSISLPSVREDYSKVIKAARERLGLSYDELGNRISEDGSVIRLLEQKKFKPDQAMAKKLEQSLGISLLEEEVHE